MSRFLTFAHCANCDKTRDLDVHGRCVNCGSDSVVRRPAYEVPPQSVSDRVDAVMERV